jgi:hypothetical protein
MEVCYTKIWILFCIFRMRHVAAYLLAVLGGNDQPSEADIKKILSSVGIDADDAQLKKVVSELKGKNLEEVLAEGDFWFSIKLERAISICMFRFQEKQYNLIRS